MPGSRVVTKRGNDAHIDGTIRQRIAPDPQSQQVFAVAKVVFFSLWRLGTIPRLRHQIPIFAAAPFEPPGAAVDPNVGLL